jgi:hypothetical protein
LGGKPLTQDWNGTTTSATKVGTVTLSFSDNDNGALRFEINGASGVKPITRQIFAAPAGDPTSGYSDLWWNPNESGWGAAITQESAIAFVTIFTYDAAGKPTWYVASNCAMGGTACSGGLYQAISGAAPTQPWSTAHIAVTQVGSVSIGFSGSGDAIAQFTVNGSAAFKAVTRQQFGGDGVPDTVYPDVFDAYGDLFNGGYRERHIRVSDDTIGNGIGCGYNSGADRSTATNAVQSAGGQVLVDTSSTWCATAPSENACIEQFDNVAVIDDTQFGTRTIEIYMGGLIEGHLSTVVADDLSASVEDLSARTKDASVPSSGNCSNSDRPPLTSDAINGNWSGYGFRYSPASKTGSAVSATMACANESCTILSALSGTFSFTNQFLFHTPSGVAPAVGATLSEDDQLASAYICSVPLDERTTFDSCTFYSFSRH